MAEERRIRRVLAQQIAAQHDMILHGIGIQTTDHADRGLVVADVEMQVRDEQSCRISSRSSTPTPAPRRQAGNGIHNGVSIKP